MRIARIFDRVVVPRTTESSTITIRFPFTTSGIMFSFIDTARADDLRHLTCMLISDSEADAVTTLRNLGFEGYTIPGYRTARDPAPLSSPLLKHLPTPGIELRTMVTRVRADVVNSTDGMQRPEVADSLVSEFVFRAAN